MRLSYGMGLVFVNVPPEQIKLEDVFGWDVYRVGPHTAFYAGDGSITEAARFAWPLDNGLSPLNAAKKLAGYFKNSVVELVMLAGISRELRHATVVQVRHNPEEAVFPHIADLCANHGFDGSWGIETHTFMHVCRGSLKDARALQRSIEPLRCNMSHAYYWTNQP